MNLIYYIFNYILIFLIAINYFFFIYLGKLLIVLKLKKQTIFRIMNNLINNSIKLIQYLSLFNNIKKIKKLNLKGKNYLVNCNHTGSIDDILVLSILNKTIK
jgi:1-acyl-sn-glycerol-3-phosphate acyltransferase